MTLPETPKPALDWKNWWGEFQAIAVDIRWPINMNDPGVYKEQYFDDGLTPSEALEEDIRE